MTTRQLITCSVCGKQGCYRHCNNCGQEFIYPWPSTVLDDDGNRTPNKHWRTNRAQPVEKDTGKVHKRCLSLKQDSDFFIDDQIMYWNPDTHPDAVNQFFLSNDKTEWRLFHNGNPFKVIPHIGN
jgi:hypothetical protein